MLETNWKMKILGNEMATWDVWNLECVKYGKCISIIVLIIATYSTRILRLYIYGVTLSNVTPLNIF